MFIKIINAFLARYPQTSPSPRSDGYLSMLVQRSLPKPLGNLWDAEFQIYSQWGEDGILNFLCECLEIDKPKVVEFGAGNFTECNSRFLAEFRNASVAPVDSRQDLLSQIRNLDLNWKTTINPIVDWITPDNVNELFQLSSNQLDGIDIVSLDIDGNDYWVAQALNFSRTKIVVAEYNPIFGHRRAVTIPRNDNFDRTQAHYSNLYYGASLKAFIELFSSKKFTFIGTNRVGNNAFFVNNLEVAKLKNNVSLPGLNLEKYTDWRVRESRSPNSELTLLRASQGWDLISDLPLVELNLGTQSF